MRPTSAPEAKRKKPTLTLLTSSPNLSEEKGSKTVITMTTVECKKIRVFAHKNKDSNEGPKALTFYTTWELGKLFDKAQQKLSSDKPYKRLFHKFGDEIKKVGDVEPGTAVYFSHGEGYSGPSRPRQNSHGEATPDLASIFKIITKKEENVIATSTPMISNGSDSFDGGDKSPSGAEIPKSLDEEGNFDSTADKKVASTNGNSIFDKMKMFATKVYEERKEKFKEVLEKAKGAMDEVKERHEAKLASPMKSSNPDTVESSNEKASEHEPSQGHGKPVAAIEIRILEGRNMVSADQPFVLVSVEGVSKRTSEGKGQNPKWMVSPAELDSGDNSESTDNNEAPAADERKLRFTISDPTSDIRFLVCDPSINRRDMKLGRVLFPVRWLQKQLLGCVPQGWKGFEGWLNVYPLPQVQGMADIVTQHLGGVQAKSNIAAEERKFYCALPKEKGSGLEMPAEGLGQIRVKIDVFPTIEGMVGLAESYIHPPRSGAALVTWKEVDADVDDFLQDETSDKILSVEGVMRILHRIKRLTKGPPLLMQPPYSAATIIWLYFICFRSSSAGFPWLVVSLLVVEGASLWWTRNMKTTLVWEHQVEKGKDKNIFEYGALVRKMLRIIGAYQYKAELIISALERFKNALSFSDPFASLLLYTTLGLLCLLAQIIISVLPSGLPLFLIGVSILSPPYFKIYNKLMRKEKKKKPDIIDRILKTMLTLAENFLNHIPDQEELEHHYICAMQKPVEEAKSVRRDKLESKVANDAINSDAVPKEEQKNR